MGQEWEEPKWRREGRTGDGPIAPRYANRRDRNRVRRGRDDLIGKPGLIARIVKAVRKK